MATIHLIDGEKGGVGKSFVARTMIQYCLDRNQLLSLASEYDVSFCKWFVCNGEYDSIKLFLA